MWRSHSGLVAVLCLAACTRPVTFATPSGSPETVIYGGTRAKVTNAIIARSLATGWTLHTTSEYQVVTEKPMEGTAAALMASRYDTHPVYRATYVLVDTRDRGLDGVRVVATVVAVTNPGSAFERTTDFTRSKAGQEVQALLYQLGRDVLGG